VKYQIYGRSETGSDIIEYLFHELSIDYEFIEVDEKNVKSDEKILKINPLGRVPMVKLPDGKFLIESLAIVYHLLKRENHLLPSTETEMNEFHQIMAFMSSSFYPIILLFYHPDHYVSDKNSEDLITKSQNILHRYLNFIEDKIGEFVIGNELSAADFYLFTLLFWLEEDHFLENYPKIQNFYNKMLENQTIIKVRNIQNERKTV
jgi:glutathione S-transferase|tara:strand:+ start:343 stop:957 length:615 start_codon:yes stop_codon:yes gene_type:complete